MENNTTYMTKMEAATNALGNWGEEDRGCRMFAKVQSLTVALKDCSKILKESFSDEEFEELLDFLQLTVADDLKKMYPDDQLFKYRTVNGHPLKGLLAFGKDTVEVNFQDLPKDHMIPEVIEAQRGYVVYRMVARCRRKIFLMANRDMTRLDLESLSPVALQRMMRLTNMLIDTATEKESAEWEEFKKRLDEKNAQK